MEDFMTMNNETKIEIQNENDTFIKNENIEINHIIYNDDEDLKIQLNLDEEGNIISLLYYEDFNPERTLDIILKKNLEKYAIDKKNNDSSQEKNNSRQKNIIVEEDKTAENKKKLIQEKIDLVQVDQKFTEIFQLLNNIGSFEENIDNQSSLSGKSDIGMPEKHFFIGLAYIYLKKKPKNIILKFIVSFYSLFSENYFEKTRPLYKNFVDLLKEKGINNDKLFVIPLTSLDHFSLMLVYNYELYLIDFGLYHSSDDEYSKVTNEIDQLYNELNNLKFKGFDKIESIIKDALSVNELNLENEINLLTKNQEGRIIQLVRQLINLEIKLSKKYILDGQNCYGDPSVFFNENLYKKIKSLNNYAIQGSQTFSYYCIASLLLIIKEEYDINKIINLSKIGVFQILTIKLLLEELFSNNQNIFKINDNDINIEYEVFELKNYKIGIKKVIDYIYLNMDNKLLKFHPTIILNIEYIKEMLISKGFKKINK